MRRRGRPSAAGMRPSNRCGGSTTWSSTEIRGRTPGGGQRVPRPATAAGGSGRSAPTNRPVSPSARLGHPLVRRARSRRPARPSSGARGIRLEPRRDAGQVRRSQGGALGLAPRSRTGTPVASAMACTQRIVAEPPPVATISGSHPRRVVGHQAGELQDASHGEAGGLVHRTPHLVGPCATDRPWSPPRRLASCSGIALAAHVGQEDRHLGGVVGPAPGCGSAARSTLAAQSRAMPPALDGPPMSVLPGDGVRHGPQAWRLVPLGR